MKMRIVLFLGSFLFFVACFNTRLSNSKTVPPNIIVLLVDDAGYADFGYMGSKDLQTPNIDELAKGGMIFIDAHVSASVCAPSRAGLLTGKYQQRFGFECNALSHFMGIDTSQMTIAEAMKLANYKTAAFGKWHVGDLALQQPHVPRTPHPRFVGTSGQGPRGDVIVEADWCIGEFIKTLEKEGVLENTLIVLTSDNGPVLNDGYYDDAVEKIGKHTPWGPLRGGKYSLFEAGTRVPFITYWNGQIQPVKSDAMVSQIDLFSSIAALVGSELKDVT